VTPWKVQGILQSSSIATKVHRCKSKSSVSRKDEFANASHSDLEDFIQSMKGTHVGDSKAPLLSSAPSFGTGNAQLPNELSVGTSDRMDADLWALRRDALARSEISTSIPPRLPDFPWLNDQTQALTFELIQG
jgi:hypothetical protein